MSANVYNDPAAEGCEIVAQIDAGEDYSFSIVLVLVVRDADGNLWGAWDSGCSCPTPFDEHTFPTDFTPIRSLEDARPLLANLSGAAAAAVADFTEKLRGALA